MPRKFQTPASVAQNRESQRRSRARQRDLLDEMRDQLKRYQRRDAVATAEMQRAARAVAEENRRLRRLLARRGVTEEEVRDFLAGDDGDECYDDNDDNPDNVAAIRTLPSSSSSSSSSSVRTLSVPLSATAVPSSESQTVDLPSDGFVIFADDTPSLHNYRNAIGGCIEPVQVREPCSAEPTSRLHSSTKPLETPCSVAAGILAELYSHKDATEALVALGCSGTTFNCSVKNEKVFQLMDEAL
ncbi:arsenicals resistance [Hypoxylon texense]